MNILEWESEYYEQQNDGTCFFCFEFLSITKCTPLSEQEAEKQSKIAMKRIAKENEISESEYWEIKADLKAQLMEGRIISDRLHECYPLN